MAVSNLIFIYLFIYLFYIFVYLIIVILSLKICLISFTGAHTYGVVDHAFTPLNSVFLRLHAGFTCSCTCRCNHRASRTDVVGALFRRHIIPASHYSDNYKILSE